MELLAERGRVPAAEDMAARAFDAYIDDLDACGKTRATYRRALRRYGAFLASRGLKVQETTRADVLAYKSSLEATRSAATVNAYLVAVRGFYGWLEAAGAHPNIAAGIKGVRKSPAQGRDALTVEQARSLAAMPAATLAEKRDRAMIALMLRRGLRTIEIARADVGDLRTVDGEPVLYVQGKGHAAKDAFVVLGAECMGPLADYLEARGRASDAEPLFAGIGNRNRGGRMTTRSVARAVKAAYDARGISGPRLTAHSLRHTAVTLALKGGATVQEAQAMARHADISTTMIYAHNLDRMEARAEKSVDAMLKGAS